MSCLRASRDRTHLVAFTSALAPTTDVSLALSDTFRGSNVMEHAGRLINYV